MQGLAELLKDPVVLLIVLIAGVLTWCMEAGYYQTAENMLKLMGKHTLSSLAGRLKWLYRFVVICLTSVYLGSVVLPIYGVPQITSIAESLEKEVYVLAWFSILTVGVFHMIFRRSIFSTQAVPVKSHHFISVVRVALFYDGFPRFMEPYHILIKLLVLAIYAALVLPMAVYLSISLSIAFARWYGFINHKRTRR